MLQQTTVVAVLPRFARFLDRWPDVGALAAASDSDVMGEWAGLGYYARARNLIACARMVAGAGGFPRTAAGLRNLPGIGVYTASAIAAIAFGEDCAPIDTNVERVIARLAAIERPKRSDIERRFLAIAPPDRAGDVAQAMMDLGSATCRPRTPRCTSCPLPPCCQAFASGRPESFPRPKVRTTRPQRYGTAWWIERDRHLWLVRRPRRGLLGGMAALPGSVWTETRSAPTMEMGTVRHLFTHFALDLSIEPRVDPVGEGWWQPLDQLEKAGLPTLYRRACVLALEQGQSCRPTTAAAA